MCRTALTTARSELPVSTLAGARSTDEEDDQGSQALARTEGPRAVVSAPSGVLDLSSQSSGPLIHDPSTMFGSGTPLGHACPNNVFKRNQQH